MLRLTSIFVLCLLIGCPLQEESGKYWDMINVNTGQQQGDAHLISGPLGTILVDTGSRRNVRSSLLPALEKRKLSSLDAVIITHPHFDHYGGLVDLLKSPVKIGRIYMRFASKEWMTREWWGGKLEDQEEILKISKEKGVPLYDIDELDVIKLGEDFTFEKLFVFSEDELQEMGVGPDINELSLIASLRYKNISVLFAGDLNKKLSNILVEKHPGRFVCDILKFPHHGAEGFASDAFIKATNANVFMVPAPYGLWKDSRCDRTRRLAEEMDAAIFTNGTNGSVSVVFKNDDFQVVTEK